MAHKLKPLVCAGTTQDDNSEPAPGGKDSITPVGIGALAGSITARYLTRLAERTKEYNDFINQSCGADCTKGKITTTVAPNVAVTVITEKGGNYNANFQSSWNASVECVKKKEYNKPIDISGPGGDKIGTFFYECIDGFLWLCLANDTGHVIYSKEKTDIKCPEEKVDKPHTAEGECIKGVWWINVKDPAGELWIKKKTTKKCEEPKKDK